jgi:DNA-binding response OmpR family regulator
LHFRFLKEAEMLVSLVAVRETASALAGLLADHGFDVGRFASLDRFHRDFGAAEPMLLVVDLEAAPEAELIAFLRRRYARGGAPAVLLAGAGPGAGLLDRLAEADAAHALIVEDIREAPALARAVLRRRHAHADNRIRVGDLEMDLRTGRFATPGGEPKLEPRGAGLLRMLALSAGETVSRASLLRCCAGPGGRLRSDGLLNVHVYKLRRSLEAAACSVAIRASRSQGYALVEKAPCRLAA